MVAKRRKRRRKARKPKPSFLESNKKILSVIIVIVLGIAFYGAITGFFIPPITYGYLIGFSVNHFNKSGKVNEIGNAIEIGAEIENRIDQGVPKEEIERFLEGLKEDIFFDF